MLAESFVYMSDQHMLSFIGREMQAKLSIHGAQLLGFLGRCYEAIAAQESERKSHESTAVD